MSLEQYIARKGTRYAFTIAEFCESHRLSRSALYDLWAAGKGPAVKRVGVKKLITVEAAAAWRSAIDDSGAAA